VVYVFLFFVLCHHLHHRPHPFFEFQIPMLRCAFRGTLIQWTGREVTG
jgi:hypothetical protein